MDEYKSWIVPEKDIDVSTHRRWLDEEQTDSVVVVEIKHIPSGIIVSSENKIQKKAYNETLKTIENYILILLPFSNIVNVFLYKFL